MENNKYINMDWDQLTEIVRNKPKFDAENLNVGDLVCCEGDGFHEGYFDGMIIEKSDDTITMFVNDSIYNFPQDSNIKRFPISDINETIWLMEFTEDTRSLLFACSQQW